MRRGFFWTMGLVWGLAACGGGGGSAGQGAGAAGGTGTDAGPAHPGGSDASGDGDASPGSPVDVHCAEMGIQDFESEAVPSDDPEWERMVAVRQGRPELDPVCDATPWEVGYLRIVVPAGEYLELKTDSTPNSTYRDQLVRVADCTPASMAVGLEPGSEWIDARGGERSVLFAVRRLYPIALPARVFTRRVDPATLPWLLCESGEPCPPETHCDQARGTCRPNDRPDGAVAHHTFRPDTGEVVIRVDGIDDGAVGQVAVEMPSGALRPLRGLAVPDPARPDSVLILESSIDARNLPIVIDDRPESTQRLLIGGVWSPEGANPVVSTFVPWQAFNFESVRCHDRCPPGWACARDEAGGLNTVCRRQDSGCEAQTFVELAPQAAPDQWAADVPFDTTVSRGPCPSPDAVVAMATFTAPMAGLYFFSAMDGPNGPSAPVRGFGVFRGCPDLPYAQPPACRNGGGYFPGQHRGLGLQAGERVYLAAEQGDGDTVRFSAHRVTSYQHPDPTTVWKPLEETLLMPESVVYNPADAPPGEREELYVKSILAIARDDLGRVVGREEIDTFHWDANTPPETTRQKVAMHVAVVGDSAPATVEWQIRGNPDRSPNDLTETLIVGLTLPVDTLEVRRIGEACAEAQNECERGAVCSGGSCEAIETPPDAVLRFHRATMKAELLGSVFGDAANAWIAADGDDECDAAPASLYRLQPTEFALPGAYLPEAETVWAMVTGGPWYRVPVQVVDQ